MSSDVKKRLESTVNFLLEVVLRDRTHVFVARGDKSGYSSFGKSFLDKDAPVLRPKVEKSQANGHLEQNRHLINAIQPHRPNEEELDDQEMERIRNMMNDRRIAVSAEKMSENEMKNWKPPCYEKTPEQREEIRRLIHGSKDGKIREVHNSQNVAVQEKFHRGIFKGAGNISDTL